MLRFMMNSGAGQTEGTLSFLKNLSLFDFFVGAIAGGLVGLVVYGFHYRIDDVFAPELRQAVMKYIGGGALIGGIVVMLFKPAPKRW